MEDNEACNAPTLIFQSAKAFEPFLPPSDLQHLAGLLTRMAEALNDDALLELAGGFGRLSPVVSNFYGGESFEAGATCAFFDSGCSLPSVRHQRMTLIRQL